MNETEKTHVTNRFSEAVHAGLFGLLVGFIIGGLPIVMVVLMVEGPENLGKEGGWFFTLLAGLIMGFWGAMVGGLLCVITGATTSARSTVRAFATKGVAGGLIGVLLGFITGVLAFGSMEGEGQWFIISCATFSGWLGIVAGTIAGTWSAARSTPG